MEPLMEPRLYFYTFSLLVAVSVALQKLPHPIS